MCVWGEGMGGAVKFFLDEVFFKGSFLPSCIKNRPHYWLHSPLPTSRIYFGTFQFCTKPQRLTEMDVMWDEQFLKNGKIFS